MYLINNSSISPNDAYTIGYGSARPVTSDDTEAGRLRNNRVDIVLKMGD